MAEWGGPDQKILHRHPPNSVGKERLGNVGDGLRDSNPDLRRGGKGITLDMIHEENKLVVVVRALKIFVRLVPSPINSSQGPP